VNNHTESGVCLFSWTKQIHVIENRRGNPETLTTVGTHDTERRLTKQINHKLTTQRYWQFTFDTGTWTKTKQSKIIKNEKFRDTGNIGFTRHRTKIDKNKIIKNEQFRDTGNIGHTSHRTKASKTK
jgi:hypothetical protein